MWGFKTSHSGFRCCSTCCHPCQGCCGCCCLGGRDGIRKMWPREKEFRGVILLRKCHFWMVRFVQFWGANFFDGMVSEAGASPSSQLFFRFWSLLRAWSLRCQAQPSLVGGPQGSALAWHVDTTECCKRPPFESFFGRSRSKVSTSPGH